MAIMPAVVITVAFPIIPITPFIVAPFRRRDIYANTGTVVLR